MIIASQSCKVAINECLETFQMSSKVQIEICGATGLRNVGTFFSPPQHLINHKVPAVLVTSATGCCASFYHRFCNYLAEQGCPVYVYDYVGVGKSAWPSADAEQEDNDNCDGRVEYLRRIEHVNIQSWAADLDIVLKWFNDQVQPAIGQDRREIVYVSHSVHYFMHLT